jgi:UDP-N-acetylmuramate dehydrogenase
MVIELDVLEDTPLAQHCSLELGGPARYFIDVSHKMALLEALKWAEQKRLKVAVLGGGTNLVIADQGFDGLVIKMSIRGVELRRKGAFAELTAAAGEIWDPLVELAVQEDLAGIECLSGIPGLAGSTVIQNVGAYGQEISQTIARISVLDRLTRREERLGPEACCFAYRDSYFKRFPESRIVLSVVFKLFPEGAPTLNYPDIKRELRIVKAVPTLRQVRKTVQNLRRKKSMPKLRDALLIFLSHIRKKRSLNTLSVAIR